MSIQNVSGPQRKTWRRVCIDVFTTSCQGFLCTSSHQTVITTLLLAICRPTHYQISVCIAHVANKISDLIQDFGNLDLFLSSSAGHVLRANTSWL